MIHDLLFILSRTFVDDIFFYISYIRFETMNHDPCEE